MSVAEYPPLQRPSRRFARYAARKGRAALTDASAAGVPSHEEHVCSSVLKENRSATAEPSSGMGGASGGAAKEDTIPKPVGLAEAAATANPNRDRAEIERRSGLSVRRSRSILWRF